MDSLVRLVLQMYDPDGVTIECEKENESATVSSLYLTCESSAIFTLAACPDTSGLAPNLILRPHRGQTIVVKRCNVIIHDPVGVEQI